MGNVVPFKTSTLPFDNSINVQISISADGKLSTHTHETVNRYLQNLRNGQNNKTALDKAVIQVMQMGQLYKSLPALLYFSFFRESSAGGSRLCHKVMAEIDDDRNVTLE